MRLWAQQATRKATVAALALGLAAGLSAQYGWSQTTASATRTTLAVGSVEAGGRWVPTFSAAVIDSEGEPVKTPGAVTLLDGKRVVAGAALDATGKANIRMDGLAAERTACTRCMRGT